MQCWMSAWRHLHAVLQSCRGCPTWRGGLRQKRCQPLSHKSHSSILSCTMWFTDQHQSAGLQKQHSAKGSGTLHLVVSAFTASANQSFQRGDGVDARIRDLQSTPSGKCCETESSCATIDSGVSAQTCAAVLKSSSGFRSSLPSASALYCFAWSLLEDSRSTDFLARFSGCSASCASAGVFGGMVCAVRATQKCSVLRLHPSQHGVERNLCLQVPKRAPAPRSRCYVRRRSWPCPC